MSTKATSSSTTTAATTTTTTSTPPLPTPPFIPIPGLPNFRDAGGYPLAADPARKMVRRGVLFRSSEPSMLTPAGVAALRDGLGVRTVYDLRSRVEIDRDAGAAGGGGRRVREWDGSERVFAPVFSHEDYSPEAIARRFSAFAREGSEGFVEVYAHILKEGASPAGARPFATILRHLASPAGPPAPLLVHCTAGKDRTGVLVAVVLSLCGVGDEAVAHEYALTDLGLRERKKEFVAQLVAGPPLEGRRADAERMVSSRRESMAATLRMMRARWGGAEGYVRDEVGLGADEVEAIRRNLMVDIDGAEQAAVAWEEHAKLLP